MSGLSRSGSFSIHSLVEGSEAISEAEEIQEVRINGIILPTGSEQHEVLLFGSI